MLIPIFCHFCQFPGTNIAVFTLKASRGTNNSSFYSRKLAKVATFGNGIMLEGMMSRTNLYASEGAPLTRYTLTNHY